jgi:Tat protein secretion system quality control protein TatD with DNase activity
MENTNTNTTAININDALLVDSHCHLQYFSEEELTDTLKLCSNNKISYCLTNSTNLNDFDKTIEISKLNLDVKIIPGLGYHPWYLDFCFANEDWFNQYKLYLNNLQKDGINFFIGEIGIDGGRAKK